MPPARRSIRWPSCSGFGYPGGPIIDRLAPHGEPAAVRFTFAKMKGQRARFQLQRAEDRRAALGGSARHGGRDRRPPRVAARVPAAIGRAVAGRHAAAARSTCWLLSSTPSSTNCSRRAAASAETMDARTLIVSGGVACNSGLRAAAQAAGTAVPGPLSDARPLHRQCRHDWRRRFPQAGARGIHVAGHCRAGEPDAGVGRCRPSCTGVLISTPCPMRFRSAGTRVGGTSRMPTEKYSSESSRGCPSFRPPPASR